MYTQLTWFLKVNSGTRRTLRFPIIHVFLAVALTLMAAGCGGNSAPEPVVMTPSSPTAVPTFTPTNAPAATATTAPATAAEEADSETTAPLTETQTVTATTISTDSQSSDETADETADEAVAEGSDEEPEACAYEPDLDLVGYPDLGESMGCAVAPASYDDVAINEFGEGSEFDRFMLWFGSSQLIYTMLPDGSWQAYPDDWTEDEDEILCNPLEGEATSPPLPRRGFGKLWCSDASLQETLGTIPREERLCQHAVTQQFEAGQLLACFEDATIRYFRILEDGTWDIIFVQ